MENYLSESILKEFENGRYKSEEEEKLLMKIYSLEYDFVSGLSMVQEEIFQKIKGKLFELKELERKELFKFILNKIKYLKKFKKSKNIDIKY